MKTYLIYYSTGIIIPHICKTLRAAKLEASKRLTYQMELNGAKIIIYEENINNPICMKSYNRFTCKQSNIGKWIKIGE